MAESPPTVQVEDLIKKQLRDREHQERSQAIEKEVSVAEIVDGER